MLGEESFRAAPEPGRGLFPFITKDFGVHQPGMVIDRGMQIRVPDPGTMLAPRAASEREVPTTVGDPPQQRHRVAVEHFRDRGLRKVQVVCDPVRAPVPVDSEADDASLGALRGSGG